MRLSLQRSLYTIGAGLVLACSVALAGAGAGVQRAATPQPWLAFKTSVKLPDNYSCAELPRRLDRLDILPGGVLPSTGSTVDDPAWSPNGAWIAFSSGHPFCSNADGVVRDSAQIWVVESGGRHLHALTTTNPVTGGPADASPSWSPDGRRIAFARLDRRLGTGGIYVVGSDGRGLRRVLGRTAVSLDWSPDGRSIAFVPGENLGPYYSAANRVLLLDLRSRHVRGFRVQEPYDLAWSPDGTMLAVTAGNRAILITDARGTVVRRLAMTRPGRLALDGVTWSPDGHRLAYGLGGTIFTVGADGRGAKRVAAGAAPDWRPVRR